MRPSAYYHWRRKPIKIISESELLLYREDKRLFKQTRSGIGYVKLCRAFNRSGFAIGETKTRSIMRKLGLVCTQRLRYKSTTNSKHSLSIKIIFLINSLNLMPKTKFGVQLLLILKLVKAGVSSYCDGFIFSQNRRLVYE